MSQNTLYTIEITFLTLESSQTGDETVYARNFRELEKHPDMPILQRKIGDLKTNETKNPSINYNTKVFRHRFDYSGKHPRIQITFIAEELDHEMIRELVSNMPESKVKLIESRFTSMNI